MKIKEFIIESLKDTVYLFENIQCRYAYDDLSEIHYVEIVPSTVFKSSRELRNYRGQILDKFYECFPNDSLAFITNDSNITFNEIFKITGNSFTATPTVNSFMDILFKDMSTEYKRLAIEAVFQNTFRYDSFKEHVFDVNKLLICTSFSTSIMTSIHLHCVVDEQHVTLDTLFDKDNNTAYKPTDKNSNALAA
jgi:hypothetical protein